MIGWAKPAMDKRDELDTSNTSAHPAQQQLLRRVQPFRGRDVAIARTLLAVNTVRGYGLTYEMAMRAAQRILEEERAE